jgi:hypothetical protein
MVPPKQPDETIVQYIEQLNDTTSLHAGSKHRLSHIGWWSIIYHTLITFLRTYILQGYILKGIDGFIIAWLAAIYSLSECVKRWEYQLRLREGGSVIPPVTEKEIQRLKMKYSN